jgi:predicted DNA-binding ribbon-helix-helix protein
MRTTLTIDDDVLQAAKELAARQGKSVGEVISALTREALRPAAQNISSRNGVPLLPIRSDATPVTLEIVNSLRDELPG